MCGLKYASPSIEVSPEIPPGGKANPKRTDGIKGNLSTTPSSLQIMLKLSPAVGTPGIMTRGVKTALLSAEKRI